MAERSDDILSNTPRLDLYDGDNLGGGDGFDDGPGNYDDDDYEDLTTDNTRKDLNTDLHGSGTTGQGPTAFRDGNATVPGLDQPGAGYPTNSGGGPTSATGMTHHQMNIGSIESGQGAPNDDDLSGQTNAAMTNMAVNSVASVGAATGYKQVANDASGTGAVALTDTYNRRGVTPNQAQLYSKVTQEQLAARKSNFLLDLARENAGIFNQRQTLTQGMAVFGQGVASFNQAAAQTNRRSMALTSYNDKILQQGKLADTYRGIQMLKDMKGSSLDINAINRRPTSILNIH